MNVKPTGHSSGFKAPYAKVHRVTVKSLQESLQAVLSKNDDLQERVESQFKLLEEQRKMLVEQWAIERALRHRLEALGSILNGALKVAYVPSGEVAAASGANMASPESPQ